MGNYPGKQKTGPLADTFSHLSSRVTHYGDHNHCLMVLLLMPVRCATVCLRHVERKRFKHPKKLKSKSVCNGLCIPADVLMLLS